MTRNKTAAPGAREALEKFKLEIANELGINSPNSNPVENGILASTHTGYITKKLVEMAEMQLARDSKNKLS